MSHDGAHRAGGIMRLGVIEWGLGGRGHMVCVTGLGVMSWAGGHRVGVTALGHQGPGVTGLGGHGSGEMGRDTDAWGVLR